jgi:UPF0755 protein
MKTWMKLALGVALAAVIAAAAGLYAAWRYVETPVDPESNATAVFRVETGENLRRVSAKLEEQGLIRHAEAFRTYGRYRKLPLQAGEFELSRAMSPRQILETLAFGKPILYRLSFAEGLTVREVARAVNATGLTTGERFLEACRDRDYLLSKGINATDAEGYLFPETYFFARIPDQSPYANRLRQGWLLQCDPTIIYGLGENFDGNLRRSHLQDASNPYNTYVHPGLPPGPICSPGKASLQAAASPEEHGFFYFVARPDGSHQFSRTLREHNNAVIRHQRKGRPFPAGDTGRGE